MSGDLSDYRKEIDRIDDEILRLLNERSKSVVEIGKLKKQQDADANLHTPAREAAIIERLIGQNTGPFPSEAIRPVYREIMSASLSLEGPQKVAYLGPRATFTHMACMQKFGSSAQYVPVNSIKDVFSEVERGRANFGVVPIENTTEGVVNHTLDMFIDSNLLIYGEVLQEVSHHLMSKSGAVEEVKKICSHPHAIAQCRNWLETNMPHVPVSEVASTARAAEMCLDDPVHRRHRLRTGRPVIRIEGHQVADRRQSQQLHPVPCLVTEASATHRQRQDVTHVVDQGQSRCAIRFAPPLRLPRVEHDQDRIASLQTQGVGVHLFCGRRRPY